MRKIQDILDLSVAEKIILVEEIWDSITTESKEEVSSLTNAQKNEILRRISLYKSGQTKTFPWDEVKASIRRPT
jgi:putative addiction module component (TIGR02574 family)